MDCTVEVILKLKAEGFTTDQITAMCADAAETAAAAPEAEQAPAVAAAPAAPAVPVAAAPEADAAAAPAVTVFGQGGEDPATAEPFVAGTAEAYLPGRWKVVSITDNPGTYGMVSGLTQGSNRSTEFWEIRVDGGQLVILAASRSQVGDPDPVEILGGRYGEGSFEVTLRRGTVVSEYRLTLESQDRMRGTAITRDTYMEESGLGHIAKSTGMDTLIEYSETVTATRE